MPEDGHTTRITTGTNLTTSEKESSVVEYIWDDEDTKAFYESLPNLRFQSDGKVNMEHKNRVSTEKERVDK